MARALIALILIGSVIAGVYWYIGMPPVSEAPAQETDISWTLSERAEEGETYTLDLSYPVFNIPSVDAEIQKAVDAGVEDIKELPANPPESAAGKHEFVSRVGEIYASPNLVSVELLLWQYTGGAHGLPVTVGVNVNPATGEVLALSDALLMIGKTLDEVSQVSLSELGEVLGEDVIFPEGAAPKPENFSTFVVNETSVTFVFQVYQVAAYSAGVQKVSFPRI